MGTRTLFTLSQQPSPAPTQRPRVQPTGKVPVSFRQGLGTPCSCLSQLWGHPAPQGSRKTSPGATRSISPSFGVAPGRAAALRRGGRRALVTVPQFEGPPAAGQGTGTSQWVIHSRAGSLSKAFCSSRFNTSLTPAHSYAVLGQDAAVLLGDQHSKCCCICTLHDPPLPSPRGVRLVSSFTFQMIKPGLFPPQYEPRKCLFAAAAGARGWARLPRGRAVGGPISRCPLEQKRAPPWRSSTPWERRSVTGKYDRLR